MPHKHEIQIGLQQKLEKIEKAQVFMDSDRKLRIFSKPYAHKQTMPHTKFGILDPMKLSKLSFEIF